MTSYDELIDRYMAAWNEMDPQRRKELIALSWTEDSSYVDPMVHADGRSGIEAIVDGVQKRFTGLEFRRKRQVDAHHDCLRFSWELGAPDATAIAGGTDFAITRNGLLQMVTGFIDFGPATPQMVERGER